MNNITKQIYEACIDGSDEFITTETTEETIRTKVNSKINLEKLEYIVAKLVDKQLKEKADAVHILTIRECDYVTAKKEISELIKEHPDGIDTFMIAENLCLDPLIVLKAVDELKEEGEIGERD